MFVDLGLLNHFNVDYTTFCRWILTVKKNYRNDTVLYHNWYHAFNVTQMMFSMLRKAQWDSQFSKVSKTISMATFTTSTCLVRVKLSISFLRSPQVDCLGLMIACLSHDLDHRGTTNAFQVKSKNPLATLYSSSTLERHHLNQCLLLLNIPGNRILENLREVSHVRDQDV